MKNYAIVVGINDYIPPAKRGLRTLKGAIKDAELIYEWLTTKGGVEKDDCKLIISTAVPDKPLKDYTPIKDTIDKAILEIITEMVDNKIEGGKFYFYFAGHGIGLGTKVSENGMCMADWSQLFKSNATISSIDYREKFISEGLFKQVIIWLDCCRNPIALTTPQGAGQVNGQIGPNKDVVYFIGHATQFNNQAYETNDIEPRGIFTEVLLEGLNGAANDFAGPVSGDDLRDYIIYRVPIRAEELKLTQTPDAHHTGNKFNPIIF